jgi:molecular chaperone DnaK
MADLSSDPMTAVAFGAAIFSESRAWKDGGSTPKKARSVAHSEGEVNIEYGYPERTSDSRIRIRVRPATNASGKGYRIQVDSDAGWTSGQLALDNTTSINDVPVGRRGDNHFRVIVFNALGTALQRAETRFVVRRTDAAAAGTPLPHTISVKILEGAIGAERNALEALIEKGHPLPANGVKDFRAASDLRPGDDGSLDFEVYEGEPGVSDPKLALHIGAFRLASTNLERGEIIRRGDRVRVYWTLDENQLLDCELEIEGKGIGRRFKTGRMFTQQGAQKNFEGQEGEALARTVLDTAQAELNDLAKTVGPRVAAEATELAHRIERQRQNLKAAYEADSNRSVAEEGRGIRLEISKIKDRRENVGDVLRAELESLLSAFDGAIRPKAEASAVERFDRLARQARESIARGHAEDARKSISEMKAICFDEAGKQPGFVVDTFLEFARERHVAIDKVLHDRLVDAGKASIGRNDLNGLRAVIGQIVENRYPIDAKDSAKITLAGLMKW